MKAILSIGVPARLGMEQLNDIFKQMKSHPVNDDYHIITYLQVESNEWQILTHNLQGKESTTVEEIAAQLKALDIKVAE